jgi:hypothetical protein
VQRKPFLLLLGLGLVLTGPLPLAAGDTKQAVPVTIIVIDSAGAPIPFAQIMLAPRPATTPKHPETSETGKISLQVIPGKYDLFVTAADFAPWAKNIQVEANGSQTVTVILQIACKTQTVRSIPIIASASVTITVTDATGAAVPYAQIGVCPIDEFSKPHDEADESGKFSLKLVPGSCELAVTSPGFRRWTQRIGLKQKENQTLKVVLEVGPKSTT